MRFGREMHDVRDSVPFERLEHGGFVSQINALEAVFRMGGHGFKVLEMAGVRQAIEVHQPCYAGLVDDVMDEVGPDKTRAPGDQ